MDLLSYKLRGQCPQGKEIGRKKVAHGIWKVGEGGPGRGLGAGRGLGGAWANNLSMLSKGANSVKAISSKKRLGLGCLPQWKELMGKGTINNPVVMGTRVAPAGAGRAGLEPYLYPPMLNGDNHTESDEPIADSACSWASHKRKACSHSSLTLLCFQ